MTAAAHSEGGTPRGRRMELACTTLMIVWIGACGGCALAGLPAHEPLDLGASVFDSVWICGIVCSSRITSSIVTKLGQDIRASLHWAHYLALAAGGVAQTTTADSVTLHVVGATVAAACIGELLVSKTPLGDRRDRPQPPPPPPGPEPGRVVSGRGRGNAAWMVFGIGIAFFAGRSIGRLSQR